MTGYLERICHQDFFTVGYPRKATAVEETNTTDKSRVGVCGCVWVCVCVAYLWVCFTFVF